MRFNFDLSEKKTPGSRTPPAAASPSTPQEEVEWILLQNHPVFDTCGGCTNGTLGQRIPRNLLSWDGDSRVYFWDSSKQCLHQTSIRLGEPEPTSVLAAYPSKVLPVDVQLTFVVDKILVNRNGSAILLAGSDGLCVVYPHRRASMKKRTTVCRTVSVGSEIYLSSKNVVRILQVSWHPYSDSHVGVLSSDSVFRLFDLSSATEQPEQEYYLQPVEPGRCKTAASICPVGFSFGGDHLWDRFSVMILFSDGGVYVLCPVVPFRSVYRWESVLEIYNDAQTLGLASANPRAISNVNLAISWLEATFPELTNQAKELGSVSALKAQPFALFDASIILQGPLPKVCHGAEEDSVVGSEEREGRAVSLLYNKISKDSVLVTAWSSGKVRIDALADEIQPIWNVGSRPRLCYDSDDRILGVAMICESNNQGDRSIVKLDQSPNSAVWSGLPPPLLRLAVVDLALPVSREIKSSIAMFADPLIPERIYVIHDEGVDSIVLHFLPFTSQLSGKDESMRPPSVHPVLNTCHGDSSEPSPLVGFTALSDSFGYSWILGITSSNQCIVLEMRTWDLLLPFQVEMDNKSTTVEESEDTDTPTVISKELLAGPKVVLLPHSSLNTRSVAADSIEGRTHLHQYFKLFHENYLEYAHKVYFELKHHAPQLKKIIDDQHGRLRHVQEKLSTVEEKHEKIEDRLNRATKQHSLLEERLLRLRNLPGVRKKPLSKAEREFKSELDRFTGVDLDALRSSIESLNARLQRHTRSTPSKISNQPRQLSAAMRKKNNVEDNEISQLKASVSKLSLVNSENTKKVQLLESALSKRDASII